MSSLPVVVLTAARFGTASRCLPSLVGESRIDVRAVVLVEGRRPRNLKVLRRRLRKIRRIGIGGALNGIRMRDWYRCPETPDLLSVAEELGVRVLKTPATNDPRTAELLRDSGAMLGISLGNDYIAERIFRTPPLGMINVHGEWLPDFQGAQSVIWSLYHGRKSTGLTIHQISSKIDDGNILYRERLPIIFRPRLADTVRETVLEIDRRVPKAVTRVVADYEVLASSAEAQVGGRTFTTPSLTQYVAMVRENRRRYAEWRSAVDRHGDVI